MSHYERPFHIWHRALYNTLQSVFFSNQQALIYVVRALECIACVLLVASSLLKILDKCNIQTQPTVTQINAVQCTNEGLTTFCVFAKVIHDCLCLCFATIRLLVNVSHVILQLFATIVRLITFNLPWAPHFQLHWRNRSIVQSPDPIALSYNILGTIVAYKWK